MIDRTNTVSGDNGDISKLRRRKSTGELRQQTYNYQRKSIYRIGDGAKSQDDLSKHQINMEDPIIAQLPPTYQKELQKEANASQDEGQRRLFIEGMKLQKQLQAPDLSEKEHDMLTRQLDLLDKQFKIKTQRQQFIDEIFREPIWPKGYWLDEDYYNEQFDGLNQQEKSLVEERKKLVKLQEVYLEQRTLLAQMQHLVSMEGVQESESNNTDHSSQQQDDLKKRFLHLEKYQELLTKDLLTGRLKNEEKQMIILMNQEFKLQKQLFKLQKQLKQQGLSHKKRNELTRQLGILTERTAIPGKLAMLPTELSSVDKRLEKVHIDQSRLKEGLEDITQELDFWQKKGLPFASVQQVTLAERRDALQEKVGHLNEEKAILAKLRENHKERQELLEQMSKLQDRLKTPKKSQKRLKEQQADLEKGSNEQDSRLEEEKEAKLQARLTTLENSQKLLKEEQSDLQRKQKEVSKKLDLLKERITSSSSFEEQRTIIGERLTKLNTEQTSIENKLKAVNDEQEALRDQEVTVSPDEFRDLTVRREALKEEKGRLDKEKEIRTSIHQEIQSLLAQERDLSSLQQDDLTRRIYQLKLLGKDLFTQEELCLEERLQKWLIQEDFSLQKQQEQQGLSNEECAQLREQQRLLSVEFDTLTQQIAIDQKLEDLYKKQFAIDKNSKNIDGMLDKSEKKLIDIQSEINQLTTSQTTQPSYNFESSVRDLNQQKAYWEEVQTQQKKEKENFVAWKVILTNLRDAYKERQSLLDQTRFHAYIERVQELEYDEKHKELIQENTYNKHEDRYSKLQDILNKRFSLLGKVEAFFEEQHNTHTKEQELSKEISVYRQEVQNLLAPQEALTRLENKLKKLQEHIRIYKNRNIFINNYAKIIDKIEDNTIFQQNIVDKLKNDKLPKEERDRLKNQMQYIENQMQYQNSQYDAIDKYIDIHGILIQGKLSDIEHFKGENASTRRKYDCLDVYARALQEQIKILQELEKGDLAPEKRESLKRQSQYLHEQHLVLAKRVDILQELEKGDLAPEKCESLKKQSQYLHEQHLVLAKQIKIQELGKGESLKKQSQYLHEQYLVLDKQMAIQKSLEDGMLSQIKRFNLERRGQLLTNQIDILENLTNYKSSPEKQENLEKHVRALEKQIDILQELAEIRLTPESYKLQEREKMLKEQYMALEKQIDILKKLGQRNFPDRERAKLKEQSEYLIKQDEVLEEQIDILKQLKKSGVQVKRDELKKRSKYLKKQYNIRISQNKVLEEQIKILHQLGQRNLPDRGRAQLEARIQACENQDKVLVKQIDILQELGKGNLPDQVHAQLEERKKLLEEQIKILHQLGQRNLPDRERAQLEERMQALENQDKVLVKQIDILQELEDDKRFPQKRRLLEMRNQLLAIKDQLAERNLSFGKHRKLEKHRQVKERQIEILENLAGMPSNTTLHSEKQFSSEPAASGVEPITIEARKTNRYKQEHDKLEKESRYLEEQDQVLVKQIDILEQLEKDGLSASERRLLKERSDTLEKWIETYKKLQDHYGASKHAQDQAKADREKNNTLKTLVNEQNKNNIEQAANLYDQLHNLQDLAEALQKPDSSESRAYYQKIQGNLEEEMRTLQYQKEIQIKIKSNVYRRERYAIISYDTDIKNKSKDIKQMLANLEKQRKILRDLHHFEDTSEIYDEAAVKSAIEHDNRDNQLAQAQAREIAQRAKEVAQIAKGQFDRRTIEQAFPFHQEMLANRSYSYPHQELFVRRLQRVKAEPGQKERAKLDQELEKLAAKQRQLELKLPALKIRRSN